MKFVDINLLYNKLSVQLLTNNFTARSKKRGVVTNSNDKVETVGKAKTTWEKNILIKQIGKNSSKVSVPVSCFVAKLFLDIQAFLINTNIVIPALHLF